MTKKTSVSFYVRASITIISEVYAKRFELRLAEVVVSGFNRMLDTIMSDMRLLTFSDECAKALWKSSESREDAHNRMMYIASTWATLANKKLAEMFRAESEIIRACKPELAGKQSPMELIAIVLESMSSKARKADEPIVSPIH
ncbi:hypothetical protein FP742_21995 [Vibrio parahaemolyticus]|uniref:hypothetical protein n=1 Tax=Vibrio parahaemolyticus TaxID=670 RepID=UPI0011222671|nr:hypothetical protein [Vibrio parahaemolyticus]EKN4667073.1 hypothetical protein [Vibrio parahaemolyticus]ELB2151809.1 hypothetical protein [Vibrio parahaemolyticus]MBE3718167.1 hypothetical protein [Vibrio parahaemolyticus]MBE3923508.1 hypothetical protein [Vibrio parahaemolyticus]MBE4151235.1 hypothetical protein [Vibrio parahaemolyticus]